MRIRAATAQDAEAIAQLNTIVQDVHQRHLPRRFKASDPGAFLPVIREWLRSGARAAFLAESDDGEPVGYALAVVRERQENPLTFGVTVVELDQLAVDPSHRRSGVGTALVGQVMEYARQQGADRVELGVHRFNEEAQAFFATVGFGVILLRMAVNVGDPDVRAPALHAVERVVFFVGDVEAAVAWYQQVLSGTVERSRLPTVVAGHVHLGFHPADAQTPAGIGGVVPYCGVESLDGLVQRFVDAGASIYRGPLTIEDGRRICQVRDPFGNVLGLVGR